MNFSCLSLKISSISRSPFIAASKFTNSNFRKLKLTKFLSNFYFSNSGTKSVYFSKSSFSHFQDSVITYESEYYLDQNYVNQGFEYLPTVDNKVSFSQCTFKNCKKRSEIQPKSGGAILISENLDSFPILIISNSAFLSCEADRGGCVYAWVTRSYLESCCYTDCSASKFTNAVFIGSKGEDLMLKQNSFTHCPPKTNHAPGVVTLVNNMSMTQYVNSSNNYNAANGVFHTVFDTINNFISFSLYFNNTGKSGFHLRNLRNVQLRKSIIYQNQLSTPISYRTETSIDFRIQYTQIWGNTYSNDTNSNEQSWGLKVFQESSLFDTQTTKILNQTSDFYITEDTYFEPTVPTYFITELCVQHQDETISNTVQPQINRIKLLSGIGLMVSIVIIVVIILVICFNTVRKKQENLWISQQSQFD